MGVCYSQEQQWEAYRQIKRARGRRHKNNKTSSVIYEEKSIYESSFASNAYASFREDLHNTLSSLAAESGQVFMGSLVEMKEQQLQILYKSLHKINSDGELHKLSDSVVLCNIKTKNYLHTHKIRLPDCKMYNQVSCCPYTSNHIPQYDIWKFIKAEEGDHKTEDTAEGEEEKLMKQDESSSQGNEIIMAYVYHPFTQRFLAYQKGVIVGSEQKVVWKIQSFGPRRNGGFLKMSLGDGQLCMSEQKGLLERHRKLQLCHQKHISHVWELMFLNPEDI